MQHMCDVTNDLVTHVKRMCNILHMIYTYPLHMCTHV